MEENKKGIKSSMRIYVHAVELVGSDALRLQPHTPAPLISMFAAVPGNVCEEINGDLKQSNDLSPALLLLSLSNQP